MKGLLGFKTLSDFIAEKAEAIGMPESAYRELMDKGKMPIPFTVDEVIQAGNAMPSGTPFHVRDTIDPDIWHKLFPGKRLQIGKAVYDHPARTFAFKGMDPEDNTANYENP